MSQLASISIHNPDLARNPYPLYREMHAKDLIYVDRKNKTYLIGKYNDVDKILKSSIFTTKPLMKRAEPVMGDRVLAQMEGKEHFTKRRMVLHGLTKEYFTKLYQPMITNVTKELIKPYLPLGKIDLVREFGRDYAVLVTLGILGLPTENYQEIAQWHKGIAEFITLFDQTDDQKAHSLDCSKRLISLITPIVEERRLNPGDDFISLLCDGTQEADLRMSTSEITALCLNILLAATEPADKTLAMMFKHLMDTPDIFHAVLNDRSLIREALEETLRLTSPVQLIPREASSDCVISGIKIEQGEHVFCMI